MKLVSLLRRPANATTNWAERLIEISGDHSASVRELAKLEHSLDFYRDGVAASEVGSQTKTRVTDVANSMLALDPTLTNIGDFVELERVSIVDSGLLTYKEAVHDDRSVIVRRRDLDAGMVDIFNFDRWGLPFVTQIVDEMMNFFSLVVGAQSHHWNKYTVNLYLNSGIATTRGFHVDSYGNRQIKVFCYLTDVLTLADGPFTYSLGSHQDVALREVNQHLARGGSSFKPTDWPIVDSNAIVAMTGKSGTLIASNQSGAHRGWPQSQSGKRIVLVLTMVSDVPLQVPHR